MFWESSLFSRYLFALACCLVCFFAKAQNIDSIKTALPKSSGREKVDMLTDLSFAERLSQPDSALVHAEQAALLAQKINYGSGMASALHKIAVIYRFQGYFDKALQYGDSALTFLEGNDALSVRAGILANNGVCYRSKGEFENALKALQRAIEIYKKIGAQAELGTVLNNVGVMYMYMEDYAKAREYYGRALKIQETTANRKEIANIFNNYAIVYANEGELDSALTYFQKSLAIEESLGNRKGMSECFNNIGAVYYYMGNQESAMKEIRKSYAIDSVLGDKRGQIACMNNIAEILSEIGETDKALDILHQNLSRARELDSNADIEDAYHNLSQTYSKQGDFETAFSMLSNYQAVHDSALGDARQKAIAEMETRFETREKEQKIKIQNLEIQENNATLRARQSMIFGLAGALLLIIIATILGYRAYKARRTAELQAAINQEQAKSLDAVIDATESERKRLARELHDGIGQQLSSIKLGLGSIFSTAAFAENRDTEKIKMLEKVVDESARDVRELSHQMMPKALTELGLEPALTDMFQKSLGLVGIDYEFDAVMGNERLAEKIEINLYRIGQELVNNIIKHSEATCVAIELIQTKRRVSLMLEDDGKGMPPEKNDGHGILNMKSRVNQVNGSIEFISLAGGGTRVEVHVPLTENI